MAKKMVDPRTFQKMVIFVLVIFLLVAISILFFIKNPAVIAKWKHFFISQWEEKFVGTKSIPSQDDPPIFGSSYSGILPCADCSGIETVLNLRKTERGATSGTYILTQTYQDKGVDQVYRGTWEATRGTEEFPQNTVYELHDTTDDGSWYFLRVDDQHLLMLDADKKKIDSDLNFTLTLE